MNAQEAAKLSALSRKQMQTAIDELAQKYRPQLLRQYQEGDNIVRVYQKAYAEGSNNTTWVKSTARHGVT